MHSDIAEVFIFLYIILQAFRTWKVTFDQAFRTWKVTFAKFNLTYAKSDKNSNIGKSYPTPCPNSMVWRVPPFDMTSYKC